MKRYEIVVDDEGNYCGLIPSENGSVVKLADAQATVEALQRERDEAKASRDMWKREACLIGDALRPLCGLSEYEFGWKPAVKIIADKLATLDAEREKVKDSETAYKKLAEQWSSARASWGKIKK